MSTALGFAHVSKRFVLQHERPRSFQERFVQFLRPRPIADEFWVLRDVSFQVEDGESFGIIGRNGAGKSTLLKLATGILEPTAGRIERNRRTYAMLELGAGFHPELTGRDNIYLSGSIHGLSRAVMRQRFDQIVDFAELERFIDTPVKHYSSGMYMRLGFATAIFMQPELLIVDEVLAVGDAAFRRKCGDALQRLKSEGVTLLFVSHNEEAVYQFCDRALLLANGQVVTLGPVDDVIAAYTRLADEAAATGLPTPLDRPQILAVAVLDTEGRETLSLEPGRPWAVELVASLPTDRPRLRGEITVHTETGSPVISARLEPTELAGGPRLRYLRAVFETLPLAAGRLRLSTELFLANQSGVEERLTHTSPHSIMIAGQGHGALLSLPFHWQDDTDGGRPRQLALTPALTATTRVATSPDAVTMPSGATGGNDYHRYESDQPATVRVMTERWSRPAFCHYLAEGYTGHAFDTYLTLANPTERPATVRLRGQLAASPTISPTAPTASAAPVTAPTASAAPVTGLAAVPSQALVELWVEVAPSQCRQLSLDESLGSGQEFALTIESDQPCYAERSIFFERYPATGGIAYNQPAASNLTGIAGGHRVHAIDGPATRWYFAEGYTGPGFETYFAIQNPADTPVTVSLRYYRADGLQEERSVRLDRQQRRTVAVHGAADQGGIGLGHAFGTVITGTPTAIVVERITYFHYTGAALSANGATATFGVTEPASHWLFAAGSTLSDHEQYLTLLNPSDQPAQVQLTYRPASPGSPIARQVALAAGQRRTITLHLPETLDNPGGLGPGHQFALLVEADRPIVAERPAYFHYSGLAGGPIDGGHTGYGVAQPLRRGERTILVDSRTGIDSHQFLVCVNLGTVTAGLTITCLSDSLAARSCSLTVPASSTLTVALHDATDPSGAGLGLDKMAAIIVTINDAGSEGLLVERLSYFRHGRRASGGAATSGRRLDGCPTGQRPTDSAVAQR